MRGNIRKRGKHSYQLKFDDGSVNGKRRTRWITVKGTYKDAQKELTRLLTAADEGTLPDPSNATLAEYLRAWCDAVPAVSPKTLERYRQLGELQIIPHLGATKLQKLKPEHIEQWHGTLLGGGLAARTVGHAHRLLRLVLQRAVKNGTLSRNVASIHAPPPVEEREIEILTAPQIEEALAKLDGHPLLPIASLALATGLRRGELLGLQWGDVNLDAAALRVERSVEETRSGLRLKSPKTKRGRRNISLPAEAVSMLRAYKLKQLELRFALGMGNISEQTLIFSTVDGNLLSPDNLSRDWRRVSAARKLPRVCFHALRHTHASVLIRAGVDILTISRRLGHSKASVTLDTYGHLIEGADAAAAKAIARILPPKLPPKIS
jgi:integrase